MISDERTTVAELVARANQKIRTFSQDEVVNRSLDETILVDIRDVRELQRQGLIEGALHAPRGMIEFWVDPESPYHKPVFAEDKTFIFYCASGWRSALATKAAQEVGLMNCGHLEGGFSAWVEAGLPIVEKS